MVGEVGAAGEGSGRRKWWKAALQGYWCKCDGCYLESVTLSTEDSGVSCGSAIRAVVCRAKAAVTGTVVEGGRGVYDGSPVGWRSGVVAAWM